MNQLFFIFQNTLNEDLFERTCSLLFYLFTHEPTLIGAFLARGMLPVLLENLMQNLSETSTQQQHTEEVIYDLVCLLESFSVQPVFFGHLESNPTQRDQLLDCVFRLIVHFEESQDILSSTVVTLANLGMENEDHALTVLKKGKSSHTFILHLIH